MNRADVDGFKSGRPQLQSFEVDELGPLDGLQLVHLQCRSGLDTLDAARLHPTVTVTGLDLSLPAIEAAAQLAAEVRLAERSRFVVGDVYRAHEVLGGERFDVVYTGKGALPRLPDLELWAAVVHDLLAPGGFLYLTEFHPAGRAMADAEPVPGSDDFWIHPISRVITAVLGAGLRLELFHEWDDTPLDETATDRDRPRIAGSDGWRRWPGPGTRPLMYSLKAVR